jgi:hypothetical protein
MVLTSLPPLPERKWSGIFINYNNIAGKIQDVPGWFL